MVPISALVDRESGPRADADRHIDGQRVTYITANLESGVALGDAVAQRRRRAAPLPLPDGFSIVYGGA